MQASRLRQHRRRLAAWLLFLIAAAAVTASQDLALDVSFFLRQRGLMRLTMTGAGGLFLIVILDRFLFVSRCWRPVVVIPFSLGLTALALEILLVSNPSEAFHCVEFFGLVVLAQRALLLDMGHLAAAVVAFVLVATYGLTDEIVQGFNPPRRFDWNDVWLNTRVALESTLALVGLAIGPHGGPVARTGRAAGRCGEACDESDEHAGQWRGDPSS